MTDKQVREKEWAAKMKKSINLFISQTNKREGIGIQDEEEHISFPSTKNKREGIGSQDEKEYKPFRQLARR